MKKKLVLAMPVLLALCGCTTLAGIADDDLARDIKVASARSVEFGVRYAMQKEPAKAAEIADAARVAVGVLERVVLPALSGSSTGDVLRSAVDEALKALSGNVSPVILSAIQLAVNLVAQQVKLPANPADKLDERSKKAVGALFGGIDDGLKAATSAAATSADGSLSWPK